MLNISENGHDFVKQLRHQQQTVINQLLYVYIYIYIETGSLTRWKTETEKKPQYQ